MSPGLKGIKSLEDFDFNAKSVFLRLDLNVPMRDGKITDDNRILAALPTIKYLMDKGAHLILASHLGRPKTTEDRKTMSLEPVAARLGELLKIDVLLIEEPRSDAPKGLVKGLKSNQVLLLENLRFDEDETKNGQGLADAIKDYTDIYINDAFGASHRAHSSVVALARSVNSRGVGLLMQKELQMLDKILYDSEKAFVTVLGGAKVSDKIGVIEKLINQVDAFIVGGAMAYTFLAAQGIAVGNSLVEKDKLKFAADLLSRLEARNKKMYLPVDHMVTRSINDIQSVKATEDASIEDGWLGVDIGPKTRVAFKNVLEGARTVFWNGPMGIFETKEFAAGTYSVAETLANSSALTIVGGGDSAAAARQLGFANKMDHISTGGGASLEYLQGDTLPGLQALKDSVKRSEDGAPIWGGE